MLAGIVGFKIALTKLEGQLKLGQNKSKDDQTGVLNALNNSNNLNDLILSSYMQKMNLV
jgi:transcriptional regulator